MTECTFGFLYLNNSDGETEIKRKMELFSQKHNIGTVLNDQEIHNIIRDELPFYATPEIILKTLIGSLQDINSSIKEISYEGCFSSSSFSYEKYEIESGTALYWALNNQRWGSQSIVKYLLQRNADPNIPGKDGMTPVHLAAKNESPFALDIMKLLLAAKGNPNAVSKDKDTPIHFAAQNRSNSAAEIMDLLLNNTEGEKGDPNVVDRWGNTPVHLAAQNTSSKAPKILEHLLKKQKNANVSINGHSSTALHHAAYNESIWAYEITKLLMEHGGADPIAFNRYKHTPLHCAAFNKSPFAPEIMELLLLNNDETSNVIIGKIQLFIKY